MVLENVIRLGKVLVNHNFLEEKELKEHLLYLMTYQKPRDSRMTAFIAIVSNLSYELLNRNVLNDLTNEDRGEKESILDFVKYQIVGLKIAAEMLDKAGQYTFNNK